MSCEVECLIECNIGIAEKEREEIVLHLNRLLSDEFVFYTKALKFHWNVKGPFFGPLHAFFEKIYTRRAGVADLLAERVQALGHKPFGTLTEFLKNTRLEEMPGHVCGEGDMLFELLEDLHTIIKHMREDAKKIDKLDPVTSNMLLGVIEGHEKDAWMIRSHLECISCDDEDFEEEAKPAKKSKGKK